MAKPAETGRDPAHFETFVYLAKRAASLTCHKYTTEYDPTIADFQSLVGQTISRYRIVEKIGGGGMGVVYEAEDLTLGHHLALGFLSEHLAQGSHLLPLLSYLIASSIS